MSRVIGENDNAFFTAPNHRAYDKRGHRAGSQLKILKVYSVVYILNKIIFWNQNTYFYIHSYSSYPR